MTDYLNAIRLYAPTFLCGVMPFTVLFLLLPGPACARFTVLHNFDRTADGEDPTSTVAVADGSLFGTTQHGGDSGEGIIWSFNIASNSFSKLHDFGGSDGIRPDGGLVVDADTLLGTANDTIWSLNITDGAFTTLHEFISSTDGDGPRGTLALDSDSLFGINHSNGGHDLGTIWQFDTAANAYDVLYRFGDALDSGLSDGALPEGGVTIASGMLFGTTTQRGAHGVGTIWTYDIGASTFMKLHDFLFATDGGSPRSNIVVNGDILYGTTSGGGTNNRGTLWSLDTADGSFVALHDFTVNSQSARGNIVGAFRTLQEIRDRGWFAI